MKNSSLTAFSPKKIGFSLAILLLMGGSVVAQDKIGAINGKTADAKGEAVPFANVLLLNAKDSSLVKGAITDVEGKFGIEKIAYGKYLVSVRMMGFNNYYTPAFEISKNNPTVNFNDIKMAEASTNLKEVVVTAQKPMIEVQNNAVVMNVAASPTLATGTTFDALSKAPGVSTDQDGKISLKGKQNVIVLIDGKQTYLSGDDLTRLLQSTQASSIEKIEVIENPSAKYDAAGNAGIINVVMKRDKNLGFNGTANAGFAYGQLPKANAGLTVNYRSKKFNLFSAYDFSWSDRVNSLSISRIVPAGTENTNFDQKATMNMYHHNNNVRVGGEYYIAPKTSIGFLATGTIGDWSSNTNSRALITGFNTNPYNRMQTNSYVRDEWTNGAFNLNFKHSFTKGDLTADLDYSNWSRKGLQDIPNRFFKDNDEITSALLRNGATTQTDIIIKAFKVDYTLPLKNGINLEMGVKTSFVDTDNNLAATLMQDNRWVNDPTRSNRFTYNENINAAYLNANKKLGKKWSLQGGLRLENTNFDGYSVTLDKHNKQNYTSLFPSASISFTPNDKHKISVNYSRRIDRPNYRSLNPFIMYLDKYTYNVGNPFLNPQFTNTFGITYAFNNFLFITTNYNRTTSSISEILGIDLERQATYQTMTNLNLSENYSVNITAPIPVRKWWLINANLTSFYNRNELPENRVLSQLAFQGNIMNIFTLPYNMKFEVTGFYQSPMVYSIFEMEQQYKVDLGLSTSFWNNQFKVKASFTDVFNTFQFKAKTQQPQLNNQVVNKWETQVFRINLSYVFGNKEMKASRKRNTASDDLQQRVGGDGN